MNRGYQQGFSKNSTVVYDTVARERKARTMIAILEDFIVKPLKECHLLDVGGSTGIIDNYLSTFFYKVIGIDIDDSAISHARNTFNKVNLEFKVEDAMNLSFSDESFDVVICSHVYEHVPDADKMFSEIYRVLQKGGVCYFSAGNRLMINEPHYNLKFLSLLPRPLAHLYLRILGRGSYYYEKHLTYWGLKSLTNKFLRIDYTAKVVTNPTKYFTDYMLTPHGVKYKAAKVVLKYFYWVSPGYIWLLQKP